MERISESIKEEIKQNTRIHIDILKDGNKQNIPPNHLLVSKAFDGWAEYLLKFVDYCENVEIVNKAEKLIENKTMIEQGTDIFPDAILQILMSSLIRTSLDSTMTANVNKIYPKAFGTRILALYEYCDELSNSGPNAFTDSSAALAILPYLMASFFICATKKVSSARTGETHAHGHGGKFFLFVDSMDESTCLDNCSRYIKDYVDSFFYLEGYLCDFLNSGRSRCSKEVKKIANRDGYRAYLQAPHIEGNSYKLKDYTKTDLQYEASFQALIYSFCVLACSKVDGLSEKVDYSESYELFSSHTCAFETILSFKPHPNQEESIKDNEDGKKRINQAKAQLDEIGTNPQEDEDELLTELDYAELKLSHEIFKSAKLRVPLTIAQVLKKPSNVVELLHSLSGDETKEERAVIQWTNELVKNGDPINYLDQYLRGLFSENDDMLETIDILLNECKRDNRMESYTPVNDELLLNHRCYLKKCGINFDQLKSEPAKGTDEWYIQAASITVALLSPWGKTLNLMRFDALPIEGDDE